MKISCIKTTVAGMLFMAVFSSCANSNGQVREPIVEITSGYIEGEYENNVYAFKGIPYAQAERFLASRPVDRWTDTLECCQYGPWAIQGGRGNDESGNFLINVWSQGLEDGAKRPIMVWIHGGGYSSGSGNMAEYNDGVELAKKGVVIATLNHRLDIMGFLDLSGFGGKWKESQNAGMLDIVRALEWIRDNADAFGGDKDNVTIFGESGGGGKVGTLMCMPAAKGLFHKAIIESGAKLNVVNAQLSDTLAKMVVKELGLTKETLDRIQTMPYAQIARAGNKCVAALMGPRTPGSIKMWGFVPSEGTESLPKHAYTPGFSDLSKDIPLIIGSTFNELDRTYYDNKTFTQQQGIEILKDKYGEENLDGFLTAYRQAYPYKEKDDILDMVGLDCNIRAQSIYAADWQSANATAPVYMFLFNWYAPSADGGKASSFHSLEIPFVFNNPDLEKSNIRQGDENARVLAEKMSQAWVNFAYTGNPNAKSIKGLPKWKPYTKENGATMIFDNCCEMRYGHDRALQELLYRCLK